MALLMRRFIIDAQSKLRRMVEEHSTANILSSSTHRIETECNITATAATLTSSTMPTANDAAVTPPTINAYAPPTPPTNNDSSTLLLNNSPLQVDSDKPTKESLDRPTIIDSKKFKDKPSYSFDTPQNDTSAKLLKSFGKSCSVDYATVNLNGESKHECGGEVLDNMTCSDGGSGTQATSLSPQDLKGSKQASPESPQPGCSNSSSGGVAQEFAAKLAKGDLAAVAAAAGAGANVLSSFLSRGPTTTTPNGTNNGTVSASVARRLRLENERLQAEITRLRRLVVSGVSKHDSGHGHGSSQLISTTEGGSTESEDSLGRVQTLEIELQLAREAISTLKSDRKRLKAERFDLLNQMKQLYATLEDKEKELRDFIRNYEQMRDSETSLQQLNNEREERERERWSLLRHARDEAERSLSLAAQLNAKELQLQQAQEQLQEARRQLIANGCLSDQESIPSLPRHSINGGSLTPGSGGLLSSSGLLSNIQHGGSGFGSSLQAGDRGSCSADSGVRVSSDRDSGGATSIGGGNLSDSTTDGMPAIHLEGSNIDVDSISVVSSIAPHMYQSTPKDCSPTLSPLNANAFTRSIDSGLLSRSVEQLSSPLDVEPITAAGRRIKATHTRPGSGSRGGTWGSISRVFARSRHRNKLSNSTPDNDLAFDPYRSWSPLTEEGYAEKLRLLREASSIPMERWRAPTVLAWIEIALGMPQYGARCAENVKSGKIHGLHGQVLLELSDLELECGLGITHPMHRKKLRLAIEEHRNPNLVRYPCISQLGHTWVSSEWLPDLGLAQYSENFATNMVDARMLDQLSKKELEKFLGVTRKFHQASIVHGIHLLRIMKYDRQALAVRRHQCESVDADPLVWTNQRFIRWARNIDLGEYSDNLKDSGVHGGLVVLEPSFNGDTMATALGIPPSKNMIRRHLMAELEALILPARNAFEHYIRVRNPTGAKQRVPGGSLGRSFSRSCGGMNQVCTNASCSHSSSSLGYNNQQDTESRRSSLRGSLSRAFGLMKGENRSDKQSPTSSSETSSIISRLSPPPNSSSGSYKGTYYSAGESPIYSQPLNTRHSGGSFLSNLISENDDEIIYETPLPSCFGTQYNQPKKDFMDNIISDTASVKSSGSTGHYGSPKVEKSPSVFKNNFLANSLHRGKRNHRRVKSIGDIDSITVSPV